MSEWAEDRKKRLIVFAIMTTAFVVSMVAMFYWAANTAIARVSSISTPNIETLKPQPKSACHVASLTSQRSVIVSHLFPYEL